jgi:transposase-like protein
MDGIEVEGEDRQARSAAKPGKRTRRQWTAADKRRIVREVQRPGAVRQEVAQRHGVHVSVLNRWRTEQLSRSSAAKKKRSTVQLLPVQVRRSRPLRVASRSVAVSAGDMIEVAFPAGQRLTVRGVVDGGLLRTVLQELSRC